MPTTESMTSVSVQALKRMPSYLHYLKELRKHGTETVSAAKTAAHFGFTEIQVRKDFASISTVSGRPKQGFSVDGLIDSIEEYLGFRNANEAVIVGAGSLGHALISYKGFAAYGLKIVAAFDDDYSKCDREICGVTVLHADRISDYCRRTHIHIGIITVPAESAQTVCDRLVAGGVKAIWNFAPAHLSVPNTVLVQNENMAGSLAVLSKKLGDMMKGECTE